MGDANDPRYIEKRADRRGHVKWVSNPKVFLKETDLLNFVNLDDVLKAIKEAKMLEQKRDDLTLQEVECLFAKIEQQSLQLEKSLEDTLILQTQTKEQIKALLEG